MAETSESLVCKYSWRTRRGEVQVEIGSLSLVAGWEAQVYVLQSAGIDLFSAAKQASTLYA